MQKVIGRQTILILTIAVAISVIMLAPALGQEKIKTESKVYGAFTKVQRFELNDVEGHMIGAFESKGVATGKDGATYTIVSTGVSDLVKGAGAHNGYQSNTDKDGDMWFGAWKGTVSPMETPSGKTTLVWEGTWTYTRGTGKYEGITGGGTYKGMFIGDGIWVNNIMGEYSIKK